MHWDMEACRLIDVNSQILGESGWPAWPRSPSLGNRFRAPIQLPQRFCVKTKTNGCHDALGLQLDDSHYNVRVTIKCRSAMAHHIQEGE
jgi:hypothetical protein